LNSKRDSGGKKKDWELWKRGEKQVKKKRRKAIYD
jgi:hypothetical protein